MAPTIEVSGPFHVIIYSRDHPPPHVHVRTSDAELRVYLRGVIVERTWGRMTPAEERDAAALVRKMQKVYCAAWKRIGPKPG
jgi:hypothetical protein